METTIAILLTAFLLAIIRAQMFDKMESRARYEHLRLPKNRRGNLYTRILRAILPPMIKQKTR